MRAQVLTRRGDRLALRWVQLVVATGVLTLAATGASGQAQRAPAPAPSVACEPIAAERGATITFGHEGGSLRPRTITIAADGRIRAGGASATDSVAAIPPAAVTALATLAHEGGFWTLSSPPVRRPPRNPDAARTFIEVTLSCGAHRVEYVTGEPIPPVFSGFEALLAVVTGAPPSR